MATNFKMPNKKTTIAIVVAIILLLVIAVTGTVAFLKDRGRTEAADLEEFSQQDKSVVEQQQSSGSEQNQGQTEENAPVQEGQTEEQNQEQAQVTDEQTGEIQTATDDATTTINQNSGTVRTDNIQETTIERVETEEIPEQKVSEGHYVGWSSMELTNISASSQINVTNKNDIKITKKATTKSGDNLVTKGEEITYDITVKNDGIKDVTALEVKDRIPENTKYVENSAGDAVEKVMKNKSVIGLVWKVDLKAGEEKTVSFKVTVKDGATGVITNVALAHGEETEPVKNSIIEASKTAVIEGKEQGESAKVGDKITYTITVKNTGDIEGTANVKDTELKNLIDNKILEIDEASQEIANKLIEGTTVDVPANGEGTLSFTAKVVNVNGAIKNIVSIGELQPEAIIDTYGLEIEKELTKIQRDKVEINKDLPVKEGDILTYTIKVTNVGSTVVNKATITDELPQNLKALTQTTFSNVKIGAGKSVSKEVKVEVTSVNGAIVNIAKVQDEERTDNNNKVEKTTNTIDISIDKKAELEKSSTNNKEEYKNIAEVGDIIHYTVSVTNNGNVKLEGLRIVDETMNEESTITLEAGETNLEALKFDHEVVATDIKVEAGKITYIYNTAAAIYTDEENPDNNVTVRDTKNVEVNDKYDYVVNYLEEGTNAVLAEAKTVDKQTYQTSVTEKAKEIEGYKADEDEKTITINAKDNVINFYYTKRADLSYTVNYLEEGTNVILAQAKTVDKQTYQTSVTEKAKEIEGYKADEDEKTITINVKDNVINFYYTKRADLSYTVNYLEKGTNAVLAEAKTVGNQTYRTSVTEKAKEIDGYNVDEDEKTITIEVKDNVINFYYTKRTDLSYTVNYLEKGTNAVLAETKTVSGQTFGTVIQSSSERVKIEKYRYDSADKETLTIGTKENVINLYYVTNVKKITVIKEWTQEPDETDTATIRPVTIELQLKAKENGKDVVKYAYSLNTATETSHEFEVDEYDDNGDLITYIADEAGDLTNYDKSVDGYTITNAYKYAKLVPTKKAYKDEACTQEVDVDNEADNFQAGATVYYKLSVTNKGKVKGSATVTDDMPSYLENYGIVKGTASLNSSKVTWNVRNLEPGNTESIILKGTVKQIKLYKDLSTKTGSETGTTAKLFVRKDGLIPYEGSNTPYSVDLYTKCVGTVYLNSSQAIAYGDLSKSDIYDLISRNNNIIDIVKKGISHDALKSALASQGINLKDDEVVIWYVNKKESDGWHIDGAIRKISDLQKVTNTLSMVQTDNQETVTATADIKLSTIATNIVRSSETGNSSNNTFSALLEKVENNTINAENVEDISKQVEENDTKTNTVKTTTNTDSKKESKNVTTENKSTETKKEVKVEKEEEKVENNTVKSEFKTKNEETNIKDKNKTENTLENKDVINDIKDEEKKVNSVSQ